MDPNFFRGKPVAALGNIYVRIALLSDAKNALLTLIKDIHRRSIFPSIDP